MNRWSLKGSIVVIVLHGLEELVTRPMEVGSLMGTKIQWLKYGKGSMVTIYRGFGMSSYAW